MHDAILLVVGRVGAEQESRRRMMELGRNEAPRTSRDLPVRKVPGQREACARGHIRTTTKVGIGERIHPCEVVQLKVRVERGQTGRSRRGLKGEERTSETSDAREVNCRSRTNLLTRCLR